MYFHERPKLHDEGLHRAFWRASNRQRRLTINISEVAERYGVGYDLAHDTVIRMREQGRIRPVGYDGGPTRRYQVADPDRWRADEPDTHARPRTRMVWG